MATPPTRRRPRQSRGARPGQATLIIAWTMLVLGLVAGLVIDGGAVFEHYRAAYNLADAAARAGANELDRAAFRGGAIALDPAAATAVAAARLAPETGAIRVLASPETGRLDRVEVTLSREAPTHFMRLAGVRSWRVTATATQQLQFGG
jgi:hypothetical protein